MKRQMPARYVATVSSSAPDRWQPFLGEDGDVATLRPEELGEALHRRPLRRAGRRQHEQHLTPRQLVGDRLIVGFTRQQACWHQREVVQLDLWPPQRPWAATPGRRSHRSLTASPTGTATPVVGAPSFI